MDSIVAKKWDPGILDPGPFSGQKKKGPRLYSVWKLGKLDQIRKDGMGY